MEYSIHVLIKNRENTVFESTKTAQEMKDQHIPQKQLHTDNEPLPMLREGDMYNLCSAVEVGVRIKGQSVEDEGRGGILLVAVCLNGTQCEDNGSSKEGEDRKQ